MKVEKAQSLLMLQEPNRKLQKEETCTCLLAFLLLSLYISGCISKENILFLSICHCLFYVLPGFSVLRWQCLSDFIYARKYFAVFVPQFQHGVCKTHVGLGLGWARH